MKNNIGILLLGHGSKLPYNKIVVKELAEKLNKIIDNPVKYAFMELESPDIASQVKLFEENDIEKIIVVPAFLSHGIHTKVDIPTILRLPHKHLNNPHHHNHHHRDAKSSLIDFHGEIILLEPFNYDEKIVDIIKERISNKMETLNLHTNNTAILLIGHGSSLPYGKEVLEKIQNNLKYKINEIPVELSFMRIEKPSIPESFAKIDKYDNIIVMPVFLADGLHTKVDIPSLLGLETEKIDIDYPVKKKAVQYDGNIIYLDPLKSDDKLVELIKERINKHL